MGRRRRRCFVGLGAEPRLAVLVGVRPPGRRWLRRRVSGLPRQVRASGRKGGRKAASGSGQFPPSLAVAAGRRGEGSPPGVRAAAGTGSGVRDPGAARAYRRPAGCRALLPLSLPNFCPSSDLPCPATSGLPGREEPRVSTANCTDTEHSASVGKPTDPGFPPSSWGVSAQTLLAPKEEMVGSGPDPPHSDSQPPVVLERRGARPFTSSAF